MKNQSYRTLIGLLITAFFSYWAVFGLQFWDNDPDSLEIIWFIGLMSIMYLFLSKAVFTKKGLIVLSLTVITFLATYIFFWLPVFISRQIKSNHVYDFDSFYNTGIWGLDIYLFIIPLSIVALISYNFRKV
jgi:hypothetical protein